MNMKTKHAQAFAHSLGGVLAFAMSAIVNRDPLLAIIHYLFSWLYVVWALAVHGAKLAAWWAA